MAFTGALSAAVSISASIRGDCNEKDAASWHTERVSTSYTRFAEEHLVKTGLTARCRFLVVVLSAYKQMKAQTEDVLSDIGEDNFDRAFKFIRPGTAFC